jgi:hypothetical protein
MGGAKLRTALWPTPNMYQVCPSAKSRLETYPGPRLPEPVDTLSNRPAVSRPVFLIAPINLTHNARLAECPLPRNCILPGSRLKLELLL